MSDTLTIVVPCYNEQEVLPETVKELGNILQYLILFETMQMKPQISIRKYA